MDHNQQPPSPSGWGQPGYEAPTQTGGSRPHWKKKRVIIPAVLLALAGIGSVGEDQNSEQVANLAAVEERAEDEQAAAEQAAAKAVEEAATAKAAEEAAAAQAAQEAAAAKAAEEAAAAKAAEEAAAAKAAEEAAAAEAAAAAQAAQEAAAAQAAQQAAAAAAAQQAAPASASYANCSEVKAAGAAPIYRGDPGYSKKLDRDGDGVACET